jgi:hypothetical protein
VLAAFGRVELLTHAVFAAAVVFEIALRLVVDRVDLALGELGREERRDEELREPVDRSLEGAVRNLELVVRVVGGGIGVGVAAVAAQIVSVFDSDGYFSVPRKSMCSRKCASPGRVAGSSIAPAFTTSEAADLLSFGSESRSTRSPLSRTKRR